MGSYQSQLKSAEAELEEAILAFYDAESSLNVAAWTFYEAQDLMAQKKSAVAELKLSAELEAEIQNECYRKKVRL